MKPEDVLSSDPEIVSGAVVFKGTRVPVSALFAYLGAGDSLDEFLLDFPTVERQQAEGAVQIAAENLESRVRNKAA